MILSTRNTIPNYRKSLLKQNQICLRLWELYKIYMISILLYENNYPANEKIIIK